MRDWSFGHFHGSLLNKKMYFPWMGQIEPTYCCDLDCIHCYSKCRKDKDRELSTGQWKKILDEIHKEGCLYLGFSGGDPLIRDDFLEIYDYAKRRGFIITIFTNGQRFSQEIIDYLVRYPPFSIEITLNGITKETYEAITQIEGSFARVMKSIKLLKEKGLKLILKSNCLTQNKDEIVKIKRWILDHLDKPKDNKHYFFKYDPMIHPCLNGDKTPTNFRLSFAELLKLRTQDSDMWEEYEKCLDSDFPDLERDKGFLYRCNMWMKRFFIDPFGRFKFCLFTDKFSVDLKTTSVREGFYKVFPQLLKERFKTESKCKDCHLRPVCYNCPARAYLEAGDEESPVEYYCQLAECYEKEKQTRHTIHSIKQ